MIPNSGFSAEKIFFCAPKISAGTTFFEKKFSVPAAFLLKIFQQKFEHIFRKTNVFLMRQRRQKVLSVRFFHEPRISQNQAPAVVRFSNQAPDSLAKLQNRVRQSHFKKRNFSAFPQKLDFRFDQRNRRICKRQTRQNHLRKRAAGNVDSRPKTLISDQNSVPAFDKFSRDFMPRNAAFLNENFSFVPENFQKLGSNF